MKINNLNYNELKNSIGNKQLLLDLDYKSGNQLFRTQKIFSSKTYRTQSKFETKHRILSATGRKGTLSKKQHSKNPSQSSLKTRPQTCNPSRKSPKGLAQAQQSQPRPRTATNRFYTTLDLKKNKKQDIFLELSKQIKRYFSTIITHEQKSQTLEQLKLLLNILQKQKQPSIILLHLQKLETHLSRFLKHRICHLFFYLIYYKFFQAFQCDLNKELKLLTLAQYHARTFYFRKVALLVCIEIQQKLVKMNNYDQSRKYAIKSLKLAVLINDRYQEVKMLEYIGVLKYYEGVLNITGSNLLTQKQRINILRLYNQEDEIPKIFQFLQKDQKQAKNSGNSQNKENSLNQNQFLSFFDKEKVYFNQGQNFISNNVPASNLKKFNRNFHGIGKKLNKNCSVKQTIKKVREVGEVKKFFGRDNYITLYPQGNTIKQTFQNQVLVTHKKYAQMQKAKVFMKKQLPQIIDKLQTLIWTEIYEKRQLDSQDDQRS